MNIILPLGGSGKRFSDEQYSVPKPFVMSLGDMVICKCIQSLNPGKDDKVFVIYRQEYDQYEIKDILRHRFDCNFTFVPILFETRGAAETVLLALDEMTYKELEDIVLIVDSDNIYNEFLIQVAKKEKENLIFYFTDKQTNPIFSYIRRDNEIVTEVQEKIRISDDACSGAYCFKDSNILKKYIKKNIEEDRKSKNEFYISTVYEEMIKNGETVKSMPVGDYFSLGTPKQLKTYSSNWENTEQKRFCFDLDGTLVSFPKIPGDYSSVEPIVEKIEFLRRLKERGHYIIIQTARRMKTHKGNVGGVQKDIAKVTLDTLEKFNIPYDEIYFGKPWANFYIDDLAVNAHADLEKETGFYNVHPETRNHNNIRISGDRIVKISSLIEGEKFWYQNIPPSLSHYFPKLIGFTEDSITIERVTGIPVSYMNIHQTLNAKTLLLILRSLQEIHGTSGKIKKENIDWYANYIPKLKSRLSGYDISQLPGVHCELRQLEEFFEEYSITNKAEIGTIHGDPVFSNILIDNFNNLKFIDMKGKVGNTLTIRGDIFYDYAKVYQSIIGYDFVLMNKVPYNMTFVENNKRIFRSHIESLFGNDRMNEIKNITRSLLLSLLPLHNSSKTQMYYNLIQNIE